MFTVIKSLINKFRNKNKDPIILDRMSSGLIYSCVVCNKDMISNSKINYLSNCSEYFFTFIKDKNPTFNSEYDNAIYNYPLCHGKERLEHPTQKPLGLIKDLIVKHSNKGDIVLDTFAGTSTTGIACIETERRFICVERDEKYYEISKQRIEKFI